MRIPIPAWWDKTMDWCASWLPAPKPIGLKILGREIVRTDLAVAAGLVIIIGAYGLYYQTWGSFLIGFGCAIFAWMVIEWLL